MGKITKDELLLPLNAQIGGGGDEVLRGAQLGQLRSHSSLIEH